MLIGDFSRFEYDPEDHFSAVWKEQGRVELDSDWNALQALISHQIVTGLVDFIGPSGAPALNPGFGITASTGLRFSGDGGWVNVESPANLSFPGVAPFTIETWVNPREGGHGGPVLGKFTNDEDQRLWLGEYLLSVETDGALSFRRVGVFEEEQIEVVRQGLSIEAEIDITEIITVHDVRSNAKLSFGELTHVAVTYDNGTFKIYINGQLDTTSEWGMFGTITDAPFKFGAGLNSDNPSQYFDGEIRQTRIWSVERTQEEIRQWMGPSLPDHEESLEAYWKFDEVSGDTLIDSTRHGNDGTLTANEGQQKPSWAPLDLHIQKGRYYVDGILCENEQNVAFSQQPDFPGVSSPTDTTDDSAYLLYLDVWGRSITYLQDEDIREVALGGPDTTTRTKTVWQVKLVSLNASGAVSPSEPPVPLAREFIDRPHSKGRLKVHRTQDGSLLGNYLYRVQIHGSGGLHGWPRLDSPTVSSVAVSHVNIETKQIQVAEWNVDDLVWSAGQVIELYSDETDEQKTAGALVGIVGADEASRTLTLNQVPSEVAGHHNIKARRVVTFGWSRENGSVAFPIDKIDDSTGVVTLGQSANSEFALKAGDWVAISDDTTVLTGRPPVMGQIITFNSDQMQVTFDAPPPSDIGHDPSLHPIITRWDQTGASVIGGVLPGRADHWTELEDAIKVYFDGGGKYETQDFWLAPSRTLTGNVEWPSDGGAPRAVPPTGVHHHNAPLALLTVRAGSTTLTDLRETFGPLTTSYVRRAGDTISGSLKIDGSLTVEGTASVGELTGALGADTVGNRQIVDGAVSREKLDFELLSVPPGYSILGATDVPPMGYRYTGSKLVEPIHDLSWQTVSEAPLDQPTSSTVSAAVGGKIYVFFEHGELWSYDPADDLWMQLPSLPVPRINFAVAALGDEIHVLGGTDTSTGLPSATHEVFLTDPCMWEARRDMPMPRSELAASVADGRLFAVGGQLAHEDKLDVNEAYDPTSDSWEALRPMPTPRSHLALAAAGGKLYAIGGEKHVVLGIFGESIIGYTEQYRPSDDSWITDLPEIPTPRSSFPVAVVNEQIYAIGGRSRDGMTTATDRFDPMMGMWSKSEPLPIPTGHSGASVVGGDIFLVGGRGDERSIQHTLRCSVARFFYAHRKE